MNDCYIYNDDCNEDRIYHDNQYVTSCSDRNRVLQDDCHLRPNNPDKNYLYYPNCQSELEPY